MCYCCILWPFFLSHLDSFLLIINAGFYYYPCGGSCVLYQRGSLPKNVQSGRYLCCIYWPVSFHYSVSSLNSWTEWTQIWSAFLNHYLFSRVVCFAVLAVLIALVASSPTMGWSGRSLSLLDPLVPSSHLTCLIFFLVHT